MKVRVVGGVNDPVVDGFRNLRWKEVKEQVRRENREFVHPITLIARISFQMATSLVLASSVLLSYGTSYKARLEF